jgi:TolA-binding protein
LHNLFVQNIKKKSHKPLTSVYIVLFLDTGFTGDLHMCKCYFRASVLSHYAVLIAAYFCLASAADAVAPEELSASGLLTEASRLLASEEYNEAVPLLTDYLERMKASEDERVLALLQDVRFKLGKIMIHLESPAEAAVYFKEYTSRTPLYNRRAALKFLAVSLFELGELESCVSAVTNAFTELPPQEKTEKKKTVDVESLSKEDLGGLTARQLKRYEEYAEGADENLFGGFSEEEPEAEPEYTPDDLILLNMTLAEAYSGLEEWEKSVDPYAYVIDHAKEEDRKGYAIMQMVNSLIKLKKFEEVRELVSQLYRTDARYDIRVNMALMGAASALFNAAEYDSALTLYRMVLPRAELVNYQMIKMNELLKEAELPEVVLKTVTNVTGRVATLFGKKYAEVSALAEAGASLSVKPLAVVNLEESIGVLQSLPPYEDDVLYRTAQLYAEVGRPWEAVALFDVVSGRDPNGEMGQRAFFECLQVLTDPLEEYAKVETDGLQFLKNCTEGIAPRQVAYQLTVVYQKQDKMPEIKKLLPYIKGFALSDDSAVLQYECELYYMQAVADLVMLNYVQAEIGFAKVLKNYPGSHQTDNVSYWHAMSLLFLQKYEEAFVEFEAYAEKFPRGNWLDVVSFRGGICLFGMEKYEQALERFTYVINTHPASTVYPDACSMRGDILGSRGLLDEALRDYREAITKARAPAQAAYATFQMAAVFEAEDRYQEIIDVVSEYLTRYGEKADVAKAAYWIGKTQLQQGLVAEAVGSYFNTIVKYGHNVRQDGVDLILSELVQVASRRLEKQDLLQLKEDVQAALDTSGSTTLKLRLRVLLAKLNGSEGELGKELLQETVDLSQAPPPVLAAVCDASFKLKDYSRAAELLNVFQTRFEDSEFMRAAYKLRGFELYASGDADAAMKLVEEAQALYGTDYDVAWAQLMKGRILLQRKEPDAAREAFTGVLNTRDWRGEPYAEATYLLGETEEAAENPRKAFAWYQRAYFQYKGHAGGYWAAEAYLASARCLQAMNLENDRRNTYRAMLFDPYVNKLPQAATARQLLGSEEAETIRMMLDAGVRTNVTITIEGKAGG